jgi:hypothetical protein
MHDDLPVGLLELAARVDEGTPIDWEAEERAAADDAARAVIKGFRVLAGVAAVAQDDSFEAAGTSASWPCADRDLSGTAWGPLRLEAAVGRGAFSQVYRAIDPLGRHVAVKLLAPRVGGGDLSARVLDEGRVLASVKHPNIVVVHGAAEHDGRVGLWMEFVHGRTLAAEVEARGAHSADEAIVVGRALCGALAAVHAKGLVHGDVKAHNVMREDGGRVVLMDFGAGRSMQASASGVDVLTGTPLYLCPERLRGGPPTAATDIYSLGVLLYHLVTRDYPVEGATRGEVDAAHRSGRRTRLRDRRPDLPDAFVSAIERAIAPEPAARFASAGAFEEALAEASRAPAAASTGAAAAPSAYPRVAGRWRLRLGLAAVAVLAIGTVATLTMLPPGRAPSQPGAEAGAGTGAAATAAASGPYSVQATFREIVDDAIAAPLTAGAKVRVGTRFTLQVQASRPLHVYVISEDGQHPPTVLFPTKDGPLFNPIPAGRLQTIPQDGGGWEVDGAAVRESLYVVTSPAPMPELEATLATLPHAEDDPEPESMMTTRSVRRRIRPQASWMWQREARPLTSAVESSDGVWVRQLSLEHAN